MPGEQDARVREVIQRTYNVKSVRVEADPPREYKAGQFLSVTIKPGLKRYLSISNSPTEKGYLEFTKKLTESDFSKAFDSLKAQATIKVQYPLGNFILDEADKKIAFLSGGIGITPIRSICKDVVDRKLGTDIVLIYSNHSAKDIAFREDFQEMCNGYPGLKVVHVLHEHTPEFECKVGRVNKEIIQESIPDYAGRKFYLCGPPGMVEAMQNILRQELVLSKDRIITENFQGY
ncbi:ferredoxin--NADP reductase [Candidatus Omnitrophota bacterium]